MRLRRTPIVFKEHQVTKTEYPGVLIHRLAKPSTVINSVTFINTRGILAVTGDFGNWIFCREFHPSADEYVSDYYWCKKLCICSTQECYEYDAEATRKEIENRMADTEEPISHEVRSYYKNLLDCYVDENKEIYLAEAHTNMPNNFDHEDVPYCYMTKFWLKAVFDAFEEICEREAAAVAAKP